MNGPVSRDRLALAALCSLRAEHGRREHERPRPGVVVGARLGDRHPRRRSRGLVPGVPVRRERRPASSNVVRRGSSPARSLVVHDHQPAARPDRPAPGLRRHAERDRGRSPHPRLLPVARRDLHPWRLRGRAAELGRRSPSSSTPCGATARQRPACGRRWGGSRASSSRSGSRGAVALAAVHLDADASGRPRTPMPMRWWFAPVVWILLGEALRRSRAGWTALLIAALFVEAVLVPEAAFQVLGVLAVLVRPRPDARRRGRSWWRGLSKTRDAVVTGWC